MQIARWWTRTKVIKYWRLGPFTTITVQRRRRITRRHTRPSMPTATYADLCVMRDQQTLARHGQA